MLSWLLSLKPHIHKHMCACTHTCTLFNIFLLINTYALCYIEDNYEGSYCDRCPWVGSKDELGGFGVSGGVSSQREYVGSGVGEELGGRCDLRVNRAGCQEPLIKKDYIIYIL